MMTNADISERYFRIQFANVEHEVYAYGQDAKVAIWNALDDLLDDGHPEPLGNATARLAVYGEHRCGAESFTIDGTHTHTH